jgi:hypothetical protein
MRLCAQTGHQLRARSALNKAGMPITSGGVQRGIGGGGGVKSHTDMSAMGTVALSTKRGHPHCGRMCSHEGTPPVEHIIQI